MLHLKLKVLEGQYAIHRFPPNHEIPSQVSKSEFFSVSKTEDELSIVCSASIQVNAEKTENGWSCFKVFGPLGFSLTGILANLSASLAEAGISIFAFSTYDTDYIMVKKDQLELASKALLVSGHIIVQ